MDITVGGASSDSYATLAEASSYLSLQPGRKKVKWLALSDASRESLLIIAAQAMEQFRYHGEKAATTQALAFPRAADTRDDGATYFIRSGVKYAQIEIALSMAEADQVDLPENVTSFTIGSYSAQIAAGAMNLIPQTAMRWLMPMVSRIGRVVHNDDGATTTGIFG